MAAPTDVLWLGNASPVLPAGGSLFHMSTAGDVLPLTLLNLSVSGIAFDGTFLYFSNGTDGKLTQRDLNGTFLQDLKAPPRAGANTLGLACDIPNSLLWRMDAFDPAAGSPKVTKFDPDPVTGAVVNTFFVSPTTVPPPPGALRWIGFGIAHDQAGKRLFLSFEAENDVSGVFKNGVVLVRDLTMGTTEVLFQTTGFRTGGMDYDPDTRTLWIGDLGFVRHISLDPINPDGTTIVDPLSSAILATVRVPTLPPSSGFVDGLAFVRGRCP